MPLLSRETCNRAWARSTCSQRKEHSSEARRPCRKASRIMVASRCPYLFLPAAFMHYRNSTAPSRNLQNLDSVTAPHGVGETHVGHATARLHHAPRRRGGVAARRLTCVVAGRTHIKTVWRGCQRELGNPTPLMWGSIPTDPPPFPFRSRPGRVFLPV